ncbi:MAG: hypothetical protein AMJ79_07405 [Phycisphaerae bacterium SM23_30]|nr:MAG: hypothetical protein AMJ79_07405 [Phycisphaerae bacterium SM23_30]
MNLLTIFILAAALAMDAFAVSVTVGIILPRLSFRPIFRLSWHFGFFQFIMPILGWAAGFTVRKWIAAFDHWIAFGLLALIGGKMIYESLRNVSFKEKSDPTRGWSLVVLSIATSIDALAVGFTIAMLGVNILLPCVIIGLVAGLMTYIGLHLGRQLGKRFGRTMELIGGLILVAIGAKILLQHLTAA